MFAVETTPYAVNAYAVPVWLAAVACLLLGCLVLIRERWSPVSLSFLLLTLTIAGWLFTFAEMYRATDARLALWWAKLAYLGIPCIPAAFYQFTVSVLRIAARHRRMVWIAWGLAMLFAVAICTTDALIAGLYHYWWGFYPRYGWLSIPYLTFFFGIMILSLRHYWVEYRRAVPETIHHRRIRLLMIASSIVSLASLDYLPKYGIGLYPFGYVPVFVFLILAALVVWRYHLVDITPAFAAQQIIGTMAEALLVFDQDGVVRVVNQAACQLFGKTEAELTGRLFAGLTRSFLTPAIVSTLHRLGAVHDVEVTLVANESQGSIKVLSVSASLMRDSRGEPIATICIARDITSRTQAEEELRQAHEELQQAHAALQEAQLQLIQAAKLESVGRLAAGVAHEVKNPLAIILTGISYLSRHVPSDNGRTRLVFDDIRYAVRRADAIVKGMLDFSAPKTLQFSREDLHAVIERALVLLKHEIDKARITVVKEFAHRVPRLQLDGNKIEQAFVNVLMNAVHAMPQGGTLTVRTALRDRAVVVDVEDTGPGVPEEALAKIFEPFFTTKPAGQGTGLGLAVTKSIVELHGGAIELMNRPEGGVRAHIMFRAEGGEPNGQEAHPHRG
ncbi:MAG: PAS domain S-box protein [Candidatus Omnitrophica bacterium]|nr:PAS domain S-box protein [Candidatus Omnitrophota bacterium]